jgi:hypothetical protein
VRLRYAHWDGLLRRYRERARQEARQDSDALIAQLVTALRDLSPGDASGGPIAIPLVLGMDWAAFEDALLTHLETPNTIRLQRFLTVARGAVADGLEEQGPRYQQSLDAIAAAAIAAVTYRRDDVYELAVTVLRDSYEAGGRARTMNVGDVGSDLTSARHWLQVALRVLAIGRAVVAANRPDLLPHLVDRPVPVMADYAYESWIRHAHVAASRRELFVTEEGKPAGGGQFLSLARQIIGERAWLRPDVAIVADFAPGAPLETNDDVLNKLAEFDLWWCVMAAANATGRPGRAFYPSCAALHQYRSQPAMDQIATSAQARAEAFPGHADREVAQALGDVLAAAERESYNYGGFWGGMSGPVAAFLEREKVTPAGSDW